ncbi:MAG: pyridoxal-phosphate dependent enzyme [Anaerolineaceae bacterium]|nr:pyridoxal-phosphate dependent enzyme [Anaerolineaceae bacterium]
MKVFCADCEAVEELIPTRWRCDCGAAWEPVEQTGFNVLDIDRDDASIWRYQKHYQLDFDKPYTRLGVGWTPLLVKEIFGVEVLLKPEYFSPTLSFKDRGTAVMINILAHQGVTHIADDSSGNAGASVAAYAASAGMKADIFVPHYASPNKQSQIAVYGANIHLIPGVRDDAKKAAMEAAADGKVILALHSYHPGFLVGQQSVGWEIWEQLGGKAPDWFIVPVGQGSQLLGVWLAFRRLLKAGLVDKLPRLVAVQPERNAPLVRAFDKGLDHVPALKSKDHTVAEGLATAAPVRGKRLLEAIRESEGMCISVEENAILEGQAILARMGIYIEPTSATVIAGLDLLKKSIKKGETVVIPLTGSGLKGSPRLVN